MESESDTLSDTSCDPLLPSRPSRNGRHLTVTIAPSPPLRGKGRQSPGAVIFTPRLSLSAELALSTPLIHTPLLSASFAPDGSKRTLHWSSAYILIISRVIGSGIFATPGVIVKSTGSIGLALLLWLLGAVVAACGLAVSLELGCMLPKSGGEKVYLEYIYRKPKFLASTVIAFQAMIMGFTASNCIVFGKYLLFAFGIQPTDAAQRICAAGLIILVTIIHGRWLHGGIAIQNALGWIKIMVLGFISIAGIMVLLFKPTKLRHHQAPLMDTIWDGSDWSPGTLATSFFKVWFAYSGFDNANNCLGEIRNPVRTLKTAAPAAMITIFFFYAATNIAFFVVVPLEDVKESGELVAALFFQRVAGAELGGRILPILIALSAAGNVMVSAFSQARVNQEIARQGFLPFSSYVSSSKPFDTPIGGLIVHMIPSLLVILLPPTGAIYSFILEVKGYPAQISSLAIAGGLLWLRYRSPQLHRPFKAWKMAVYPLLVLNCALLIAPFFPPGRGKAEFTFWHGTYALVGTGTMLAAVTYWYIRFRLLPSLRGYVVEEEEDELPDGTPITRLINVPNEKYGELSSADEV